MKIMERFHGFLIRSCYIVPCFFYVLIPLFFRRSGLPLPLILAAAIAAFLWYWCVRWKAYQSKNIGRKWYAIDMAAMALGLGLLYGIEICVYLDTNTINLVLYALASFTYAPALLRTRSICEK